MIIFSFYQKANAQIENVIVETYYISDTNDATDTTGGRSVIAGSKTYRVYLDLKKDTKIRKIYGDQFHTLKISSTEDFYNNPDRPNAYFGYLINKLWFPNNPALGLDSWLTLGLGTTLQMGIPKNSDIDGSFIGGTNNNGGTANIQGGLLINNDPGSGLPLTTADGYMPNPNILGQWLDNGFKDFSGTDTTVFGPVTTGKEFVSNSAFLQQNSGIQGINADTNIVLVAQLTTLGELSFELNIEVEEFDGTNYNIVRYVANNDTLLPGEIIYPLLKYPPVCGCTDPDYLEYDESFACSNQNLCLTPIILGCMDTSACNYDPDANFSVSQLCCYPGYCNDRNLSLVCDDFSTEKLVLDVYPNPFNHDFIFEIEDDNILDKSLSIYSNLGILIWKKNYPAASGRLKETIPMDEYPSGIYFIHLNTGNQVITKHLMKN